MNSYADLDDAEQYLERRGLICRWDCIDDKESALVRGSDYVDFHYRVQLAGCTWSSMFVGSKAEGREQVREWPRVGAVDYDGNEIPRHEIPQEVIMATVEAALREGEKPGSLMPDYDPQDAEQIVTQEKVGPLSVTYADPYRANQGDDNQQGNNHIGPTIPVIDQILAPVLDGGNNCNGGGCAVFVV